MSLNNKDRLSIIRDLMELREPLEKITEQLAELEWDYEGSSVELERKHLPSILERYIEGRFQALKLKDGLIKLKEEKMFN